MSNITLKSVLDNLKSKKASERQEGLLAIRKVFEKDKVVANFHLGKGENGKTNPMLWLPVYQALFTTVYIEKEGMKKASSRTSSTRRISEASSAIRWLTERTVPFMNKRVISALFQHFTQMLASDEDRFELFQPIALNYAKSLKALLIYVPHLEHLEAAQWVKMVEICFNVILGDPVRQSFTRDEVMEEPLTSAMETDDDMYVDDDLSEDNEAELSRSGRKRSRREPTPKPILSPGNVKRKGKAINIVVAAEQIEFTSILSILLASPVAPILSDEYPHLVSAIMARLRRFLERYPTDSSLLYDYINILSSVLDHLSLNRKHEVEIFARSTWTALVGLWGTKDKHLKEALVVVLRHLFQFIVCPTYSDDPKLPLFDAVSGIGALWHVLDVEAENKWGMDTLALDALRLDIAEPDIARSSDINAFVTKTFRSGWNFDAEQALSWSILELRADCAGKLYQLSESMQHSMPIAGTSRTQSKRIKLENPITSLLHSIQVGINTHVRNYHLQTLLFFIDRHWSLVHDSQKQEIVDVLLQYVAIEDNLVQSWVFLNFSAIAVSEASRKPRKTTGNPNNLGTSLWDSIWAHAIRRANAPIICRAACHTGQALLKSFYSLAPKPSQVLLTSSRVLLDIETFMKDMDVQGPSYPFDSVCAFLSYCLTIASQDARLYRLHLEDTVLSWFIDSWKMPHIRSRMAPSTTTDILLLLETICGLPKRVDINYRPLLPHSEIVESIIQENKTMVIRDLLLYAKVPVFSQQPSLSRLPLASSQSNNCTTPNPEKILVMARGKERRISAFFLKTLESLRAELEASRDLNNTTAEIIRQSLDIAINAVTFESLLILNGVIPNRQVLQNASKVIALLSHSFNNPNWTAVERLLVVQGLEAAIQEGETSQDDAFCQVMSQPGPDSGIKEQTLRRLLSSHHVSQQNLNNDRLHFLQLIWQNIELQDALTAISETVRAMLSDVLTRSSSRSKSHTIDVDDKDEFGPIRTANVQASTPNTQKSDNDRLTRHTIEICIGVLACGPFLQSPSSKPTRDKELVQLILVSAEEQPEMFCIACPIFFSRARQGMFALPTKYMDAFLDMFEPLLGDYTYGRSERFHCVLLDFLTSCLGVWQFEDSKAKEVHEKFSQLCIWMANALAAQNMRSWVLRDAFVRFMDKYLSKDPTQQSWTTVDDFDDEDDYKARLPTALLPSLNSDADMRVRFRAALVNASLYSISDRLQANPLEMYNLMREFYTKDVCNYEHMLTRTLSLGNIMIVSSAVRRGPYWHLLETCIYSRQYVSHIEAILTGVSERLGFPSLSALFVAYASQIAYSIRQANADITTFPPHLLGYRDRRQSAEVAFTLFTPTNLLNDGRTQFENHCKMLQKSMVDGMQECFGEIAGLAIASWFGHTSGEDTSELERYLKDIFSPLDDFWSEFEQNLDGVVTTILCCLGEQDFSESGPIVADLRTHDEQFNTKSAATFCQLITYRALDTFKPHQPNLPVFSAETLLKSLHWISSRLPNAFSKATTYHVLHLLLDKIHNSLLVNEQHRLVNAISLWIAYRRHDVEDLTILNSVIHGATLLLLQSDLTRSAQSILELALGCYKKLTFDKSTGSLQNSHLPNYLLRVCCIAHDFQSASDDKSISEIGSSLLTWIDQQAYSLSKIPLFQPVISRALAAWPHQPSSELSSLYNEIMLSDLASILEDPHLSSNKFRLVRRIKNQVTLGDDKEGQYSKTYFWRLKEYMPPPDHLQDEDADAFTQLLMINHGKISGFNPEPLDLDAPRPRQRRMFRKKGATEDALASDAIFLGLLTMLEDDDATHVSNAYHTLRLIMAISSSEGRRFPPTEYRVAVKYLKCYTPKPIHSPVPNIQEALFSDTYLESANDFKQWVSLLTVLFSNTLATFDPFFGQLTTILTADANFAEQILPILVYTLLSLQMAKKLDHITNSLQEMLSAYFTTILSSKNADLACIRSIVDVVLHLRYFVVKTNDALAYNKWLSIDYILLAQSAVLCGSYTTALLFVEIAADQQVTTRNDHRTEQVLYEIYAHIDESDGFYGIQTDDLDQFLIKRLHHENQWDKAFRFHGAALEAGKSGKAEQEGLMESFHHFGFDHLASDTSRNFPGDSSASSLMSSSMNYKLAWRTETWDLPEQASNTPNAALYRSLRAIHRERDPNLADSVIHSAFLAQMEHVRSLGSENLVEIRAATRDLMCLGQVLHWRREDTQQLLTMEDISLDSWKDFVYIDPAFEFPDLESIMATRVSLVRSMRQREERQQIGTMTTPFLKGLINIEKHCLLRLSEAARAANQTQIALNSVIRAQRLEALPTPDVSEEFSNVLWVQKEEKLAVRFLRHLLESTVYSETNLENRTRRAIWLSRLGTWTSEACLEKPADIWARYFDPSISLLEEIKENTTHLNSSHAKIYRECAMFSERQYHSALKSPDAIRWKVYVDRKKQEIEERQKELDKHPNKNSTHYKDLENARKKATVVLSQDSEHFRKHNTLRDTSLRQAIDMHSRCLATSDEFDTDSAIRLCSLWLANFDDESVLDSVKVALDRVPSRKFAFLAHQLTARLATVQSSRNAPAQENLQRLILRICHEHPFHILYQVYCLLDHTSFTTSGSRRQSAPQNSQSTQTERGTAASDIFDRLRSDAIAGQRVRDVEKLCDAYLEWAKYVLNGNPRYQTKQRGVLFKIPSMMRILKISDLRVPVSTARLPLDPTMQYKNCVWVHCYDPTFDTAGGVNLPKINICHGSDGQQYKQLFKGEGKDDLRQDAVMEQVFDLVNGVLKRDRETRRRTLTVRDYKVIPLSTQAGVLEFVGNTSPLKTWLDKAHPTYRPQDMKQSDIVAAIKGLRAPTPERQSEQFLSIRQRFRPVLRHYFTEKHKNPIHWFQMRLSYTRSVATTSIVGHILGLGDRHSSNILIDNVSGEVVHIDLGIAFDQGKLLGVPEKVPFRMTADIVDGMGPSGTAGVFQRCAEETLRVLREESEVIMTVLEVFKHDPLHQWTASEYKVKHAQSDAPTATSIPNDTSRFNLGIGIDMTSGSADEAADRALSSVARKLDKSLSVESTVNELLAEATDPTNLAALYYGWAPFL